MQTITSKDATPEVEIARCQKGQYFGELALVTNKPRAASAYAVGVVKCLGKDSFCVLGVLFLTKYYQVGLFCFISSIFCHLDL